MDTREKIISAEAAIETAERLKAQGRKVKVVIGCFDVLVAAHVRELRDVRNGTGPVAVMVLLIPVPAPLLSGRARAEMAAALDMVDYVVTADEAGLRELLSRLPADEVIARQATDEQIKQQLIEHVQRRHRL